MRKSVRVGGRLKRGCNVYVYAIRKWWVGDWVVTTCGEWFDGVGRDGGVFLFPNMFDTPKKLKHF